MKRLAVVALALWVIGSPRTVHAGPITLSILPSFQTVAVGDVFSVDVGIADALDLFAYQFDVAFDPAVVAVSGVADGGFLTSGGGTSVFDVLGLGAPFVIALDNDAGLVTAADSLLGPVPDATGVTGSGVLARLTFTALAVGVSGITLSNLILEDSLGGSLSPELFNGSVAVTARPPDQGPDPIPEPASLLLLGSGLAALYASERRQRERHRSRSSAKE